jgi:branched-chain amino acid transport system substrate-binding protein
MSLEILQSAVARAGLDKEKIREIIFQGHLRDDQRQGPLRGRAERDHADRLRADAEGQAQLVWPKSIATGAYEPKKGW